MDAFSSIPNHTGFTARNLFMDRQGILRGGAFAKIAPGGGGPLSPHRHALVPGGVLHAVWNRNTEPAEILGLTLETPSSPTSSI